MVKIFIPFFLAGLCGLLAFVLVEPYGVDQEHWDNPMFWKYAYPGICVACTALGFFFPKHTWSYGIIAIWLQGLPVLLANLDAELIGVSIVLLGIISAPPALSGVLGAWIGKRYGSRIA